MTNQSADPVEDERQLLHRLTLANRALLTAIARARPPARVWGQVSQLVDRAAEILTPYAVSESDRISGDLREYPGRGQVLVPAISRSESDASHVLATIELDEYYRGRGIAAHGGVLPLVFDELMGQLANVDRTIARTAYIRIDYRAVTPIGRPLRISAKVEREEGRKRFVVGTLHDGDRLLVEAEGLFVELLSGQP